MKLSRSVRHRPELFLFVPLATVLFLTLAVVTLSRAFILQPGLSVSLPASAFVLSPERNPQIVTLTAAGVGSAPGLYFHDRRVEEARLEAMLADPAIKDRALIIRADGAVPHGLVFRVQEMALRLGYAVSVAAIAR